MSNDEDLHVAGSSPAKRTSFPKQIEESGESRTEHAQKPAESEAKPVRFPRTIRHRQATAKIYGKGSHYPFYRVCYYVAGRRRMLHFHTDKEADHAERAVRDLAAGSQALALTAGQANDALAALEQLEAYSQAKGRRLSLRACVAEYVEAAGKLNGTTLNEAVDRFLGTVASLRRKDVGQAVEEFIAGEEPRTKAGEGQRAQLSGKYAYNRAIILRRFARTPHWRTSNG